MSRLGQNHPRSPTKKCGEPCTLRTLPRSQSVRIADSAAARGSGSIPNGGVYRELRADLEPHLDKEEQVLFPMIRQLAGAQPASTFYAGSLVEPIAVLLSEHDRVGELLAQLRVLTHGYEVPADGCASYRACYEALAELEADTHMHVHKENNLLFPAVVRMDQ